MLGPLIFLIALLMLLAAIVGLVQPARVNLKNRKQAAQGGAVALLLAAVSLTISPSAPPSNSAPAPSVPRESSAPEKALADLERKKSELAERERVTAVITEHLNALAVDISKLKGVRHVTANVEQRLGVIIELSPTADKEVILTAACERVRAANLSALNGRWAYVAVRSDAAKAGDQWTADTGRYRACPPAQIPNLLMQTVAGHPLVVDIKDGNPERESSDLDIFANLPDWQYNMPDAERKRLEYEGVRLRLAVDLCRAASTAGVKISRIGIVRADAAPPQGIRDSFRHQRIPCQ